MLDDPFADRLKDAAREYNEPPETPRDLMWEKIVAARKGTERTEGTGILPLRHLRPLRPLRLAAGIAALLALGFGLGRLSERFGSPAAEPPAIVATAESPRGNAAYRLAATEHLSQSEAFLTLFKASVGRGGNDQLASATARHLLATNRLLLDSPASSETRVRLLLQDLELVLAEIVQLSSEPGSRDLDLITEGLERGGVLTRLRTAVPSGASTTQGAL
jgi:hypothetical protein